MNRVEGKTERESFNRILPSCFIRDDDDDNDDADEDEEDYHCDYRCLKDSS